MRTYFQVKRIIDFLLSCIAVVILSPLFLILAILIKIDSRGPILFKQERVGKDKKVFYILKFRTMVTDAPKNTPTHMLKDSTLFITRIGKFLRKTSLDELPQLINILRGDMSLIGPRPSLQNQYDLIDERDKYNVHSIYPGLTGWAQINGRDELPIFVKAKLDGEYVQKMSLLFDCKVFFKTIFSILRSEGVREGEPVEQSEKRNL
ncbi:sugar transferase [Priestia endophytica]|uniref:O-antigen biosynthesis protein WbqP n=1 Tax=Priestia endophytica DSM 13796 TaxID=1121089 RepID=A0A1I5V8P4_9BACI|nr:sugar transferase [Priestia endophytica]KYG35620.1 capsular biosynthesis protein [Priestia endophytica]SFQ03802.1 O-antigen biosynthesis protein WbqP [Priestia endophytica DSM 13796]